MENKNRFIKINFEKPNNQIELNKNKTINILFFTEKKIHLPEETKINVELYKFLNSFLINGSSDNIIVRSEKGNFLLVKRKYDDGKLKDDYLEKLGGTIYNEVKSTACTEAVIYENDIKINQKIALGILLSSYKFMNYKKIKPKQENILNSIIFRCKDYKKSSLLYDDVKSIAQGVYAARDLVWQPPNILFPSSFADECIKLRDIGVEVTVYDESQLKKIGMEALLAVGRGSRKDSRVVVMEWTGGNKNAPPYAFIGKGVCFDSGGLSLKPPKSMEDMKWDMGGAATVTGLLKTVALSKTKLNIIGVIGLVENMPDGDAQRPGDVVNSISGQTIEVLNTDAEGRLVLADVLSWTEKKYKPEFLIDLATLTGAMIVALGNIRAGLFSNNKTLSEAIYNAGETSGEKVWGMPLDDEYDQLIKTEIADMKNIGGPGAGSITAACFLKRHVAKTPWAHLDIAGVTWKNKPSPTIPYGGVGWGVKMLYQLIKDYKNV
ncbi:MAG: leucyl aminopeptidase [Alphaproteobacteria bacterium]|nr:leucyl aminopeptidase [Alphaproteobacteria bacterium]